MIPAKVVFAHTIGGGGTGDELLIFFGGLVLLGIVMGAAKSVKLPTAVAVVAVGTAGIVGALVFVETETPSAGDISISITSLENGQEVAAGEPIRVEVSVQDAKIATSAQDTENPHLHIFVDGELDSMPYTTSQEVTLTAGEHEITVELVDGNHVAYDPPLTDSVTVTATPST